MTSWDHRPPKKLKADRDAAVRQQVVNLVGPSAPFWRQQLSLIGLSPKSITGLAALSKIPAVGERDVCPDGDPTGAARMVLQTDERGFAMRAAGHQMRAAYVRRLFSTVTYRRRVDAVIRPTTFHEGGMALRFPIASTRGDLDLVARAGFRLFRVMGIGRQDVVAVTLSDTTSMEATALRYAGIGAGSPTVETAGDVDALARAMTVLPINVIVAAADEAPDILDALAEADINVSDIHTLVLVGGINAHARSEARNALERAGSTAVVLFAWGPRDGRVLYGECRESVTRGATTGLHTYPDLDVLQLVDPETGDSLADSSEVGGELVLTQLGFWGSALLRWRTGTVVGKPIEKSACPACRRVVARVPGEMAVEAMATPMGDELVDLRVIAGSLVGRPDLHSWRIEAFAREGRVVVHIQPSGMSGASAEDTATTIARDIRRACGAAPTEIAIHDEADGPNDLSAWPPGPGRISPRILVHS